MTLTRVAELMKLMSDIAGHVSQLHLSLSGKAAHAHKMQGIADQGEGIDKTFLPQASAAVMGGAVADYMAIHADAARFHGVYSDLILELGPPDSVFFRPYADDGAQALLSAVEWLTKEAEKHIKVVQEFWNTNKGDVK